MTRLFLEIAGLCLLAVLVIVGADGLLERLLRGPAEAPAPRADPEPYDQLDTEDRARLRHWTRNSFARVLFFIIKRDSPAVPWKSKTAEESGGDDGIGRANCVPLRAVADVSRGTDAPAQRVRVV